MTPNTDDPNADAPDVANYDAAYPKYINISLRNRSCKTPPNTKKTLKITLPQTLIPPTLMPLVILIFTPFTIAKTRKIT